MDTDINDLDTEISTQEPAANGDLELGSAGDDIGTAWDDHLSEALTARLRHRLPRGIQHTFAGEGYLEALCEREEYLDEDTSVTVVSTVLIDTELAPRAEILSGVLFESQTSTDQQLALSWRYQDDEFTYLLTLDGKYLRVFTNAALAQLSYEMLADRRPSCYRSLLSKIEHRFETRGKAEGENLMEHCSEEFTAWIPIAADLGEDEGVSSDYLLREDLTVEGLGEAVPL
jgi:hypothetical protein